VAVVCIVERQEANGRPAVEAAAQAAALPGSFHTNEVRAESPPTRLRTENCC